MKERIKNFRAKKIRTILSESFTLARRELWAMFTSLQTYIVIGLFLVILTILSFVFGRLSDYGTSDLSQFYTYVVGTFVIIIPALTMGLIARDKEKGTIEYILTQPLHETSYVVSKLISACVLVFILMLTTLPFVISTIAFSTDADLGQIIMQFASPFLVGVSFASIGILFSGIFTSEITAFVASLVTSVLLFLIGSDLLSFIPNFIKATINRFGILEHYQSLSKGVLDFRDIIFFFALITIFTLATIYYIFRIKYPRGDKKLNRIWLVNIALVVFFIAFAYVGSLLNVRLDMTSRQKYTLSQETKDIVNNIENELKIDFFETSNLPAELTAQTKGVRDLLNDIEQSSGRVNYNSLDPIADTSLESKVQEYSIQPLQLRVNRDNSSEVVLSYYSIGISYGDKKDKLDLSVTEGIDDLEFQLAKKIKNIVGVGKLKLGVVNNNVENMLTQNMTKFNSQISEIYEVVDLTLNKDSDLSSFKGIFIPSPNAKYDAEVIAKLKEYFNNGGGLFITTENVLINGESGATSKNETNILSLLSELGVTVNHDYVYDIKNNNVVALSSDFFPVVTNFPLWFISNASEVESEVTKDLNSVSLLWANSITADQAKLNEQGLTYKEIFTTSELSNTQSETEWNISPEQEFSQKDTDRKVTVASTIENANQGRIVVVGDGQFLDDNILDGLSQREGQDVNSLSLGLNSLAWVSKDSLIGGIKSKTRAAVPMNLLDYQKVILIASVNVIPMAALAGVYLLTKRLRSKMEYRRIEKI